MLFIIEEAKETVLDFPIGTINVLQMFYKKIFFFNIKWLITIVLNVKLWNSHLNKSKLALKNEAEVVLTLSSNMIGRFNDESNFLDKLLLTNRQVGSLRKAFTNDLSTDSNLSKTHLSKMIHWGGFLGRLLSPLLKSGLPLMKNEIKRLAKSVSTPVRLNSAVSAADAGIHKRAWGSGTKNNNVNVVQWWNGRRYKKCQISWRF